MKLTDFLKKSGLTQAKFASASGCTQGAISHICTGKRKPRPSTAKKIEKATNGVVSFVDLYADMER